MNNRLIILFALFSFFILTASKCEKDKTPPPPVNQLPPATQVGKNTVGFLLNGIPWTPKGVRGTGNLSIDYDPSFKNGIFNIVAYNFEPIIAEQFTIGIRDSLNFMQSPIIIALNNNSLYGVSFNKPC